jgi:hypothetical protein
MKKFFNNNKHLFTIKKFFLLYLIVSNSIINSEIKVFPDHYEHGDEIFQTSQVNGVTFERFYYAVGYFTNSDVTYYSPKYGTAYLPDNSCYSIDVNGNQITPDRIQYNSIDRDSFFGVYNNDNDKRPIRAKDETRSHKNLVEEIKLYQNTMKGNCNFRCRSPFVLFHNKYFELTYKIPIISLIDNNLNLFSPV